MTYSEQVTQLALNASVAVFVLMGTTPGDVEFLPLKPNAADENTLAALRDRWPGRGLRQVGCMGLSFDMTPLSVFKEPLAPEQFDALSYAFLTYAYALLGERFTRQRESAEIRALQYWWSLPDMRAN